MSHACSSAQSCLMYNLSVYTRNSLPPSMSMKYYCAFPSKCLKEEIQWERQKFSLTSFQSVIFFVKILESDKNMATLNV